MNCGGDTIFILYKNLYKYDDYQKLQILILTIRINLWFVWKMISLEEIKPNMLDLTLRILTHRLNELHACF